MKRFVQRQERSQGTLFPACLDEYISDNPVRVIDVFVEELNLRALGSDGVVPHTTGRPAYLPAVLLRSPSAAISTASRPAAASSRRPAATSC
jgi:transposase